MTLQQEVYSRIDKLSDEGIRLLISIIDNIQSLSATGFKREEKTSEISNNGADIVESLDVNSLDNMTKEEKKHLFMQSAGKMRIDSDAIRSLRERSMI